MILPPDNAISSAIAIQSHQPDHIIFIRIPFAKTSGSSTTHTRFEDHKERLLGWIEGSDALLNCYPDIDDPIPIPITDPLGYQPSSGQAIPSFEFIDTTTNEVGEVLCNQAERFAEHSLRLDMLPGAKGFKTHLYLSDSPWEKWYSTEAGVAINVCKDTKYLNKYQGKHLSLIDRAWLGGNPVYVEARETTKMQEDEWQFYRGIIDSMEYESKYFTSPKSVQCGNFLPSLEERGYEYELKNDSDSKTRSSEMNIRIKKGNYSLSFNYIDQNGNASGFYLEHLVNAIFRHSKWNSIEMVFGMQVYEGTSLERRSKLEAQIISLQDSWKLWSKTNGSADNALSYTEICHLLEIDPSRLDEPKIILEAIVQSNSEKIGEIMQRYVQVCELDHLVQDEYGLLLFDSKSTIRRWDRKTFSTKRPRWLMHRTEFVVAPIRLARREFEKYNIIHFERLFNGRNALFDPEKCYPVNTEELDRARMFVFENGVCKANNEITIVNCFDLNRQKEFVAIQVPDNKDYEFLSLCKEGPANDYQTYCDEIRTYPIYNTFGFLKLTVEFEGVKIAILSSKNRKEVFMYHESPLDRSFFHRFKNALRNYSMEGEAPSFIASAFKKKSGEAKKEWIQVIVNLDEKSGPNIDLTPYSNLNKNTEKNKSTEKIVSENQEDSIDEFQQMLIDKWGKAVASQCPMHWVDAPKFMHNQLTKKEVKRLFGTNGKITQKKMVQKFSKFVELKKGSPDQWRVKENSTDAVNLDPVAEYLHTITPISSVEAIKKIELQFPNFESLDGLTNKGKIRRKKLATKYASLFDYSPEKPAMLFAISPIEEE